MKIEEKYKIGEIVYLITDKDQDERLVTGITVRPRELLYQVSCGTSETECYDFELSKEKKLY